MTSFVALLAWNGDGWNLATKYNCIWLIVFVYEKGNIIVGYCLILSLFTCFRSSYVLIQWNCCVHFFFFSLLVYNCLLLSNPYLGIQLFPHPWQGYIGGEFAWMKLKWLKAMLLLQLKWLYGCMLNIVGVSQEHLYNGGLMTCMGLCDFLPLAHLIFIGGGLT